jgi:ubiquitin-conjugating enzyme E2 Z
MPPKNIISLNTQKRLLRDVVDIMKNNLSSQGIYYIHDEENILKGYAMIFGPKDTPYENGIYFFNFNFPIDYPYSPPKLTYLTNDGNRTRFNPNLYRNGKVCLSILNTWRGEQWTSCQTIRSVLLTLVTVLNENPLINEPGIKITSPHVKNYNKIIKYRNYEIILKVLQKKLLPQKHFSFYPIIKNHILKHKKSIIKNIKNDSEKYNLNNKDKQPIFCCKIYNMNCKPCYNDLISNFETFFN